MLPDTLETIGNSAFMQSGLKYIDIPDSVTTIMSNAFNNCHYLTEISIPDSVTTLGSSSLSSCSNLTTVKLSDSLTEIEYGLFFYSTSLYNVKIPNSVTKIEAIAFQKCNSLTDITIPQNVVTIEEGAFGWCDKLNSITILNPECNITKSYISAQTNGFWGTIYGYEGSTAQQYAQDNNCQFKLITDASTIELGDIDSDGSINASDAAQVLIAAASIGAGNGSGLTAEQEAASDIDHDGSINATDAAIILMYSAAVGAGQTDVTISDFIS